MARIRSMKPELRDSRVVASWPFEVRYFFTLLWGYLDDFGRGNDMPKRIAGDCFPHDDITAEDIDMWLDLMTHGIDGGPGPVCRYEVSGVRYVHCVNWSEHQKPNRPTPSRLPACPLHEDLTEPVTEPVTEPLNESSLPGAAEQQSRGAGEQQQPPREPVTEPLTAEPQAVRLIVEATGTTPELAAYAVTAVHEAKNPRNLAGLIRTLIRDGEIHQWLDRGQKALERDQTKAAQADARASPPCPHGQPGGDQPHPISRKPFCPMCRKGIP